MKNIYINLLSELGKNIPLALAIIIETKGSTPQVQGASAIFSLEGLIKGTLGGGILEADAQNFQDTGKRLRNVWMKIIPCTLKLKKNHILKMPLKPFYSWNHYSPFPR